jgi:glycosyltransferase involved in cell wall biosynthesis
MRILVHDFCGHPFTLDLAIVLADRGHEVDYVYFGSETNPKGDFDAARARPRPPKIHALWIDGPYRKDALLSRRRNDLDYARQIERLIARLKPEALLSGNCPTEVQTYVVRACRKVGTAFVYWMQDFYSIAATKLLSKKLGLPGRFIGGYWRKLDRDHLRHSDRIVLITEDFKPLAAEWAGRSDNIDVVENWGVLADIDQRPRDNGWARELGITEGFNLIYSGTLGLKHNPHLLIAAAQELGEKGRVIVISHGASVPYLERRKDELGLDNLILLPLQPFALLPDILGAADALVATIEPDAGTFSVPSKILSYLCAGRPILLAAPPENLAARNVKRAAAGLVVAPSDEEAVLGAVRKLVDDPALRRRMGESGRAYAEATFDIEGVAERFEVIFANAIAARRGA